MYNFIVLIMDSSGEVISHHLLTTDATIGDLRDSCAGVLSILSPGISQQEDVYLLFLETDQSDISYLDVAELYKEQLSVDPDGVISNQIAL